MYHAKILHISWDSLASPQLHDLFQLSDFFLWVKKFSPLGIQRAELSFLGALICATWLARDTSDQSQAQRFCHLSRLMESLKDHVAEDDIQHLKRQLEGLRDATRKYKGAPHPQPAPSVATSVNRRRVGTLGGPLQLFSPVPLPALWTAASSSVGSIYLRVASDPLPGSFLCPCLSKPKPSK